jgi:hypothetical protein
VHGFALAVDRDRDQHVDHLELADRLHGEARKAGLQFFVGG